MQFLTLPFNIKYIPKKFLTVLFLWPVADYKALQIQK